MNKSKLHIWTNLVLLIGLLLCLAFNTHNEQEIQTQAIDIPSYLEQAELGSSQPEKLAYHAGYTVSFNTKWLIPNWVAYELTAEEVQGVEARSNKFIPDPDILESPTTDDYKNSGYDRGHMAPAADMKWSKQAMIESFYTSNICPQNQNLNKGDWKDLEEHVRNMATKFDHIYVTCGPIVPIKPKQIGYNKKIAVPDACFKVILRQKGNSWSAIGFMMPNQSGHKKLSTYAMSVDDIEIITDIDFFVALPDDIEEKIESTFNLKDWDL